MVLHVSLESVFTLFASLFLFKLKKYILGIKTWVEESVKVAMYFNHRFLFLSSWIHRHCCVKKTIYQELSPLFLFQLFGWVINLLCHNECYTNVNASQNLMLTCGQVLWEIFTNKQLLALLGLLGGTGARGRGRSYKQIVHGVLIFFFSRFPSLFMSFFLVW